MTASLALLLRLVRVTVLVRVPVLVTVAASVFPPDPVGAVRAMLTFPHRNISLDPIDEHLPGTKRLPAVC